MSSSSSTTDSTLPMAAILHMISFKLSSNNYLLWKNHMIPIFTVQKLMGHIDGSSVAPPVTITVEGKTTPNPIYTAWKEVDQRALLILQSSLSEEVMAETLGLVTAHKI